MTGRIVEIGDLECLAGESEPNKSGIVVLIDREQLKAGRNLYGEMVEVRQKPEPDAFGGLSVADFNNTRFGGKMQAVYRGTGLTHAVASCDFDECLVGLKGVISNEPETVSWVRCENIKLAQ